MGTATQTKAGPSPGFGDPAAFGGTPATVLGRDTLGFRGIPGFEGFQPQFGGLWSDLGESQTQFWGSQPWFWGTQLGLVELLFSEYIFHSLAAEGFSSHWSAILRGFLAEEEVCAGTESLNNFKLRIK